MEEWSKIYFVAKEIFGDKVKRSGNKSVRSIYLPQGFYYVRAKGEHCGLSSEIPIFRDALHIEINKNYLIISFIGAIVKLKRPIYLLRHDEKGMEIGSDSGATVSIETK